MYRIRKHNKASQIPVYVPLEYKWTAWFIHGVHAQGGREGLLQAAKQEGDKISKNFSM